MVLTINRDEHRNHLPFLYACKQHPPTSLFAFCFSVLSAHAKFFSYTVPMANDDYLDLSSYDDVYRELVFQRNATIQYLRDNHLLERNRNPKSQDEKNAHKAAETYLVVFHETVEAILNRLYSHDAIEAVYDFNSIELGQWADTPANRLERELQQLQLIISKLETRYDLKYKIIFEYDSAKCTLYMSSNKVMSCSQISQKHRVLTALFSDPYKQWSIKDFDSYFAEHFNRGRYTLEKRSLERTGNDIRSQVATLTGIKDFLLVSASSLRINPSYLTTSPFTKSRTT